MSCKPRMLLLWKAALVSVALYFSARVAGLIARYALLAISFTCLLLVGIAAGAVVDAQVEHSYSQSFGRQERGRRYRKLVANSFLTVTPTCLPTSNGIKTWPRDWRRAARKIRTHKQRQLSSASGANMDGGVHLVVGGMSVHSGLPTMAEVERGGNVVVLYSGGSWSGIWPAFPRINQLFNFCACSETSLLAMRAARYLALPITFIGFDYPTSHLATLNVGQTDDSSILSFVYATVATQFPCARIVVAGDCLGSMRVLNWLATRPEVPRLYALILESPLPSLRHFLNVFTPWERANEVLFRALVSIMPNYRPELENYQSFSVHGRDVFPNVPTFIGMLRHDPISGPRDLPRFTDRLHQTDVFVSDDLDRRGHPVFHGQIVTLASYQQAVYNFLSNHNLLPSHLNLGKTQELVHFLK